MNPVTISIIVVIIICICFSCSVAAYYLYKKKAVTPQYKFYQGMDSPGNDITNSGLNDKIPELKDWCNKQPPCKGFNTNAWMKNIILPESNWSKWTTDPNKGLYVKS